MNSVAYAHSSSFLTQVLKFIGLDSTNHLSHSFWRGGATFAFEWSVPSKLIKARGNWHSDCYLMYLEMSDSQKRVAASQMAAALLSTII